ncbi:MAG TPA: hypothetical protein PLU49_10650 [Saprospiraceae bacterium]|nr:hypothetical protein [Saprospiraceae bacterium]
MKNFIHILLFIILSLWNLPGNSQINIGFFSDISYWQHSELNGFSIGCQISKKVFKNEIGLSYSFGYGEKNRYKDFPDMNTNIIPLLITDYKNYSISQDIHFGRIRSLTDDARQQMVSLIYKMNYNVKDNIGLTIGFSPFVNFVSQFIIVDVLEGYELTDHFYLPGPINLAIISQQKFITGGIAGQLGLTFKIKTSFINPYLNAGWGFKGTSFFGIGIIAFGEI